MPIGAHVLPGTDDVAPQGDVSFSLSPDDTRVLYVSRRGSWTAPIYVLYDIAARQGRDILLDDDARTRAARGDGPSFRARCWDRDGRHVVLSGPGGFYVADTRTHAVVMHWVAESQLSPDARRDFAALGATSQDGEWRARSLDATHVQLTRDGAVIADHRALGIFVDRVHLTNVAPSPDQRRVAYTIEELRGSFATPVVGYVAGVDSTTGDAPLKLGADVHGALQWRSDSRALFGCIELAGRSPSLVVFAFDENGRIERSPT